MHVKFNCPHCHETQEFAGVKYLGAEVCNSIAVHPNGEWDIEELDSPDIMQKVVYYCLACGEELPVDAPEAQEISPGVFTVSNLAGPIVRWVLNNQLAGKTGDTTDTVPDDKIVCVNGVCPDCGDVTISIFSASCNPQMHTFYCASCDCVWDADITEQIKRSFYGVE